ncbi:fructose PTS transporter subunit IIA [Paenibacillus sp. sptzw28]|uniref:PTS sugar transporter subunit IIA n=1 Tax=Paenibacillus sp. sptzw28 TaxID=715179 RepID=UPI001C6F4276|nr:fructose PTS transporter subunit IIA [Paenibacillus sp. sptzw28]QYR21840.1 fructose PTS transporter subunit IIA [Paenibacillus sp. sptzw28]
MNITALLDEKSIFIPLEASDKLSCIKAMIEGLDAAGCISDKAAYLDTVLKREETGSTGIGFSVAIPHGKSGGVKRAGLGFAKLASPLDWQSLDGSPVSAVIMIAVPEEAAGNEHLQILIAISRKLIDEDFRNKLLAVQNSQELFGLLETI